MAKRKVSQAGTSGKKAGPSAADAPLTYRQRQFVEHYISTKGNGTKSYRLAFGGLNDNVCGVEAHHLLRDPKIQAHIQRRRDQISALLNYDRETWLRQLAGMAFCDADVRSKFSVGEITDEELGDLKYGLDCKASDRKAAMDELRDALGLKAGTSTGIEESTAQRILGRLRERRK
jgi:phage terminase small subunit